MNIPIRHIRDAAVILDADLATIYGVPTRRLDEQVKRNKERFPADFVFRLTAAEARDLEAARSQIAILNKGHNIKHLPYAFTEHGALMAGNEAILRRLAEIDKTLLLHDRGLRDLYQKLLQLLQSPPDATKRELGFHVRERAATYRVKRRRP